MSSFPKNDMRQRIEARPTQTLGDYISVKLQGEPKKLTFDEWWTSTGSKVHTSDANSKEYSRSLWNTAQANK